MTANHSRPDESGIVLILLMLVLPNGLLSIRLSSILGGRK